MRIWALSDLHVDFDHGGASCLPETYPDSDVVVIAGDVCEGNQRAIEWIHDQRFSRPVVYVAGNHEYYGRHRENDLALARRAARLVPNLHFLQNDQTIIDGVRFLGATLWTDYKLYGEPHAAACMLAAKSGLNDHRNIWTGDPLRPWLPKDCVEEHHRSAGWLEMMLSVRHRGPTVVVTHHAPSPRSVNFRKFPGSPLNAAFASNLEKAAWSCDMWIHGHIHDATQYKIADASVVCNPRGYPALGEESGWDPALVVSV